MAARKILCVTLEPISQQMAGPAIRAFELARQLSSDFGVTLFSPRPSDLPRDPSWPANLQLATGLYRSRLYAIADECEIIYLQANVLKPYPGLARRGKHLVLDLYDPYLLSLLAQYADDPLSSSASYRLMHQVLEQHMIAADFSICASERQRDYWLGRYCAIGRLTPEMYRFDPSFRKLIDVVPFGLPSEAPRRTGPGLKGNVPGIAGGDQVLRWGGGIWQWFDPVTVIEAVARLARTRPNIKLFFMGWRSPNPQVPLMEMSVRARQHARQLGVLDSRVIFHDSWVPYEQRVNYLLDADLAVSAHFDLPETRFSFRTRILDYLWAGLPVLSTGGDPLSEAIDKAEAGVALPYKDVGAWEQAIVRICLDNDLKNKYRQNSLRLSEQFTWDKTSRALIDYCRSPHHLPAHVKITMPSLLERAQSVYARGGRDLVIKRSQEIISDLLR